VACAFAINNEVETKGAGMDISKLAMLVFWDVSVSG
jgi:hypothetical protein